jgi:hypothetical protein
MSQRLLPVADGMQIHRMSEHFQGLCGQPVWNDVCMASISSPAIFLVASAITRKGKYWM